MTAVLPAFDLDGVRRALAPEPGTRRQPIGLGEVHIGADALDELVPVVRRLAGDRGRVAVLVDATPIRRGSADLKQEVAERLGRAVDCRMTVLGSDRPELHADERALAEADAAIAGAAVVVSVGSGTVTDIAKDASHRVGSRAFVVVQTAVSVNAFSDDMAVLLRDGVKRTVPSRWPDALIVDLETIAGAPAAMNQAGFGELTAMFTAPADWYLATALGMDDTWDAGIAATYRDRGPALLAAAPGVATGEPAALGELVSLMTLSGIAMGVAGRTAPYSGMEHTVSHLLDMRAEADGWPLAFHGAQVGVAVAVVATLWRIVLDRLDPESLLAPGAVPAPATMAGRVAAAFGDLDASGRAAAECWNDYRQKLERWSAVQPTLAPVVRDWDRLRSTLGGLLEDPAAIVAGLRAAGAPSRFRDLDPAPDAATVRWALASCHLMRNRFTVADLATFGGLWDQDVVDEVLAAAAAVGGGA